MPFQVAITSHSMVTIISSARFVMPEFNGLAKRFQPLETPTVAYPTIGTRPAPDCASEATMPATRVARHTSVSFLIDSCWMSSHVPLLDWFQRQTTALCGRYWVLRENPQIVTKKLRLESLDRESRQTLRRNPAGVLPRDEDEAAMSGSARLIVKANERGKSASACSSRLNR